MSLPMSSSRDDDELNGGSELRRASRRLSMAIARSQLKALNSMGQNSREDTEKVVDTSKRISNNPAPMNDGRASKSLWRRADSASRIKPPLPPVVSQHPATSLGGSALEQHRRHEMNRSIGRVDTKETPRRYGDGASDFYGPFDWQARASLIHSTWRLSPRQRRQDSDYRSDGYQRFKKELQEAASSFRARNPVGKWKDPFQQERPRTSSAESVSSQPPAKKATRMMFTPVGESTEDYIEHTIFIPVGGWRDITFVPDVPDGIELIPCSIYLPSMIGNGLAQGERDRRDSYLAGEDGRVVRRPSMHGEDTPSLPDHERRRSPPPEHLLHAEDNRKIAASIASAIREGSRRTSRDESRLGSRRGSSERGSVARVVVPRLALGNNVHSAADPMRPTFGENRYRRPPDDEGGSASDSLEGSLESEYASVMSSPYSDSLDGRCSPGEREGYFDRVPR